MGLQLNIGANVQPAVDGVNQIKNVLADFAAQGKLSIGVVEKSMQDLRNVIKQTTDPTELNRLKEAYRQLQLQLAQLKNEGGLTSQLGGISRATRTAHSDLEQISQSLRGFANGSERGADALSNLVFTFERLSGQTGGIGAAFATLGKTLLGPAGIVLAVTTLLPLMENLIGKFFGASEASKEHKKAVEDAKKALDDLAVSTVKDIEKLTLIVGVIENHNTTRANQQAALKKVNEEYGPLLKSMGIEKVTVDNLNVAYTALIENLLRQAVVKGLQDEITESVKKTAAEIIKLRVEQEKLAEKQRSQQTASKDAQEKEAERTKHLGETIRQQSGAVSDQTSTQLVHNRAVQQAAANMSDFDGRVKKLTDDLITQIAPLKNVATSLAEIGLTEVKPKVDAKGLDEVQRKIIAVAEQAQEFFRIPLNLKFSVDDSDKDKLQKAIEIIKGIKDQTIRLNVIPPEKIKLPESKLEIDKTEFHKSIETLLSVTSIPLKVALDKSTIADVERNIGTIFSDFSSKNIFGDVGKKTGQQFVEALTKSVQALQTDFVINPTINTDAVIKSLKQSFAGIKGAGANIIKTEDFKGALTTLQLLGKAGQAAGEATRQAFLKAGRSAEDAQAAAQAIVDSYGGISEKTAQAAILLDSTLTPAFQNLFDAIIKGKDPLKAFFKSIEQSVEQLIAKLIAAAVEATILNAITGGAGGGFGAIFKGLLGFKAEGGPVEGGQPYVVGERGPEFFVPKVAGNIVPNHQLKSFTENNLATHKNFSSSINKSSFSNISKTVNNFHSSIPHLQSGGITTSDTVAQLHKAEVIMPLDRLKGILGNQSIDSNVNVGGEFVLRGEDLALTLDRFSRRKGRTF